MKKLITIAIALILVTTLFVGGVIPANAASKYYYTVTTKRKHPKLYGKKIGGNFYYQLVQIEGKTKVKKKINKALKNDYNKFVRENWDNFNGYCISDHLNGDSYYHDPHDYYCTMRSNVVHNGSKYFSIRQKTRWYAGGVGNTAMAGLVFSKKTGKKLTVANFIKGSKSQINNKIKKAFLRKMGGYEWNYPDQMDIIEKHRLSDYEIYINKKTVFVCFETYELSMGNSHLVLPLKREK